jgi:hypothetical protein
MTDSPSLGLQSKSFDVTQPNSKFDAVRSSTRYLDLAAVVGLLLVDAGINIIRFDQITTNLPTWNQTGLLYLSVEVALPIGALIFGRGYVSLAPGPRTIGVSYSGVRLEYVGGMAHEFRWGRLGRGFQVEDYSDYSGRGLMSDYCLRLTGGRRVAMTREAMEGILDGARARGYRVSTSKGGSTIYHGFPPVIHRIQTH